MSSIDYDDSYLNKSFLYFKNASNLKMYVRNATFLFLEIKIKQFETFHVYWVGHYKTTTT